MLTFQHLPPVFIIEMVNSSVFWRNMFALKGGVSKTQSPSEMVLNRKLNYDAHCKVEFGEYVQTHKEHNNHMTSRTRGAIATRPSNGAGSYYFMQVNMMAVRAAVGGDVLILLVYNHCGCPSAHPLPFTFSSLFSFRY